MTRQDASGKIASLVLSTLAFAFALAVAGTACAAVAPPPDLAALEQGMAQLHVNTESVSFQEELSLGELGRSGIPFALVVAGKGEFSSSPPEGQASAGLFGLDPVQTRVIGGVLYTYESQAAQIDGGRPWVRKPAKGGQATGVDPTNMLGSDQPGPQGTFSKLIAQLNGALAIVESGPVTVEDQRVIEFDATLDPRPFVEALEAARPKRSKHPLTSLLDTPATRKTPTKPVSPPSLGLEVFIAPNGLPVRERFTFSIEGVTIAVRVDTLAVNIPVNVTAPPPAQTIDEAALKRIERRRVAQERKNLRKLCRKLHGHRRSDCLRAVLTPGPEVRGSGGESGLF
jgi:hypothetical protein